MRFINSSAKFTVYKPVTHDDTNFYTQFEMKIPSHDSEFITALGKTKFVIKDGLLQTIDINYHKTQQEYDEFQSLMNESPVAFV
ncbi:MAG: hypothetical protein COB13_006300 [OCS116 cluster bacterium]|nr:hypothetical protein [OCS116 cluster bacterium]